MMIAACKMKMDISVACPLNYEPNSNVLKYVRQLAKVNNTEVYTTTKPEEAIKNADIIVTDTWISMGQESEKEQKLKDFKGYQVNLKLLELANKNWTFLHCLPR